jgi:hypothetical protein
VPETSVLYETSLNYLEESEGATCNDVKEWWRDLAE